MTSDHGGETAENRDRVRVRWTLWLALIGGNLCGLAADYNALAGVLSRRPYQYGHNAGLEVAALLLGGLLLPGAVTGLAPRRPFLWGAVPLGLMFAWSLADRLVVFNGPGLASDFRENGIAAVILLLVVCGPVSFIRLQMRRGREAQARRLAEYQAWAQGAAEAQAGVWPPPVRPDGHYEGK